jgi:biopolymer transport protein ExbB
MFVILGIGVLIAAIAIERLLVIGKAAAVNSRKMVNDLVNTVGRGDMNTARSISNQSNTPVGQVAQAILSVRTDDETRLQAAGDDAATLALPRLARRLPHLNMLANSATLLGLLGTIFGLTTAFAAVGAADPAQRSAFLAAGISQALNTTAFGLIVAVPALLLHGWLVGLVEGITEQVDEMSIRLSQAVARASNQRPQATVTPITAQRPAAAAPPADLTARAKTLAQGGNR